MAESWMIISRSITGFWILLYYALKTSVTLVASSVISMEPGQRDKLAANFSCNSTKSYRIISYNKSIATGQLLSNLARRLGSDGSMSSSGSAGPGFNPRRGSKFSF